MSAIAQPRLASPVNCRQNRDEQVRCVSPTRAEKLAADLLRNASENNAPASQSLDWLRNEQGEHNGSYGTSRNRRCPRIGTSYRKQGSTGGPAQRRGSRRSWRAILGASNSPPLNGRSCLLSGALTMQRLLVHHVLCFFQFGLWSRR